MYLKDDQTFEEVEADLAHFIEEISNAKQLHLALGYRPPDEFEEALGRANLTPELVGLLGHRGGYLRIHRIHKRRKKVAKKQEHDYSYVCHHRADTLVWSQGCTPPAW